MACRVNGLTFQEQPLILIICSFLLKSQSVPHYCPSLLVIGLNITDPSSFANEQFNASQQVTKPLVDLILSESQCYPYKVLAEQIDVKSTIKSRRRHLGLVAAQVIRESFTPPLQLAMDLA